MIKKLLRTRTCRKQAPAQDVNDAMLEQQIVQQKAVARQIALDRDKYARDRATAAAEALVPAILEAVALHTAAFDGSIGCHPLRAFFEKFCVVYGHRRDFEYEPLRNAGRAIIAEEFNHD